MDTKIRLLFKNISEIVGNKDVGLLVLVNETETRQLTIPCNKYIMQEFERRVTRKEDTRHTALEVLLQIISGEVPAGHEIIIEGIKDGEYQALLYNVETLQPIPVHAADAVLLSLMGNLPLYISTSLFDKQSVKYDVAAFGVSLPVNAISQEMLEEALAKAVREENYELASHLRDELERRKHG
ncbi:MAG: UvrB/UvrC motif-containing protein [Prevotella sp.]|nr:UvrB/UvrC motif-containing protein [Prevotella sp.]MDD7462629.1 UvrB/UvrC motif-containing protein [Prevotellaceae bacterium]MDY3365897.1 UvrB/UvrC motif-containing protein [Prevotella sp.]MDY3851949.1 UvrB/UvrC motif-containing protein [Prevotella sp.]